MPPKKKKSGKKKGGAASAGKKSASENENSGEMDASQIAEITGELNKEFFVLHIRDLERKLNRYKSKFDGLNTENTALMSRLTDMSQEKKDTVEFLKKSLLNRGDEVIELHDRLVGLQQAKESEKTSYETRIHELRTEFQEMKDQLSSENNILAAKLAALEEFKQQKEALLQEYAELEQKLETMRSDFEATMEKIQTKRFADRDLLKKQMVSLVNQVASDFRRISHKQMAETTKRTIRENVSIQTQLTKVTDKNAELVEENATLRQAAIRKQRRIRELERAHTEWASKNSSTLKIIQLLSSKQKEHVEWLTEYEQESTELSQMEQENVCLRQQIDSKRNEIKMVDLELADMQRDRDEKADQLDQVDTRLSEIYQSLAGSIDELQKLLQKRPIFSKTRFVAAGNAALQRQKQETEETSTNDKLQEDDWGTRAEKMITGEHLNKLVEFLKKSAATGFKNEFENDNADYFNENTDDEQLNEHVGSIYGDGRPSTASMSIAGAMNSLAPKNKQVTPQKSPRIKHSDPIIPNLAVKAVKSDYMEKLRKQQQQGYCVPGSLRLVPEPGRRIDSQMEKLQSAQLEEPTFDRKSHSRSIGTQTISIEKAIFCAGSLPS